MYTIKNMVTFGKNSFFKDPVFISDMMRSYL